MPDGSGSSSSWVKHQILEMDRRVLAWHRSSILSRNLEAIPAGGPLISTALVASIPDPRVFRSGRDLSAWMARGRRGSVRGARG